MQLSASIESDPVRSHLLLLRVRMVPADQSRSAQHANALSTAAAHATSRRRVGAGSQVDPLLASDAGGALDDGAPSRRQILLELFWQGSRIGEWRMTAQDLGLPLDPEGVLGAKRLPSAVARALGPIVRLTSSAARHAVPAIVEAAAEKAIRKHVGRADSMPSQLRHGLRGVLDSRAPDRKLLWLEIGEPTGYLALLDWEALLRAHVGVPVLRVPHLLVNATYANSSLDVLLTCSAPKSSATRVGEAAAQLGRRLLRSVGTDRRCVVHVFADVQCRAAVEKAIAAADLPQLSAVQLTHAVDRSGVKAPLARGMIVYGGASRHHQQDSEASPRAASDEDMAPQFHDHPWAEWIHASLGSHAVDMCHVIASGTFTAAGASAVVVADPHRRGYVLRSDTPAEPLRFINAQQMTDFACRMGAWAVVMSALSNADTQALRAMADQMSRASTSVLVTHNAKVDRAGAALEQVYRMLTYPAGGSTSTRTSRSPLVDHRAVCMYVHPARVTEEMEEDATVRGDSSAAQVQLAVAFRQAKEAVRQVMDLPGATPAWLAVTQRRLEPNVSRSLEARTVGAVDQAAQDGADEALRIALHALTQSAIIWPGVEEASSPGEASPPRAEEGA